MSAQQADGGEPIDRAVLAAICGGDEAFERRVLGNFRRALETDSTQLNRAVADQDYKSVADVAHGLKGASRTVGATALGEVCERIEKAGRKEDGATIQTSMPVFTDELARVHASIDNLVPRA